MEPFGEVSNLSICIFAIIALVWGYYSLRFLRALLAQNSTGTSAFRAGIADILLLAVLSIMSLFVSSKAAQVMSPYIQSEALYTYAGTTIMNVLFISSAFIFLRFCEQKPTMFCQKKNPLLLFGKGAWAMLKIFALFAVIVWIWGFSLKALGFDLKEQDAVEFFRQMKSPLLKACAIFTVVVLAPIWEEIFFRGFIYGIVKSYLGVAVSALATSILFAFVHASLYAFLPIFVLSLFFILLYEKSGDLRVSMGAHAMFNLFNAIGVLIQ